MPRSAWLTLTSVALITLTACSGTSSQPTATAQYTPPPAPSAPPPPEPAPPSSPDQQFVDQAAAGGMAEVELGRMAREKAANRGVKAFGARMVADHTRVNNRLMAVAKRANMTPSPAPDPQQQSMRDQLASASGPDFDKQYIDGQVSMHQQTIQLFEGEVQGGQDPRLRRLARETLPTLRAHLRQAEAIAKRMGG
ncbi:MAG: DUF4142 domain-containing protein [Alphaproteobacteria bacterium]|nr:DUF4142 domain-containing protein [Alphaproteobacteria bacterium]